MANRIKDIAVTATSTAGDDYIVIDGSANGTRKILASSALAGVTSVAGRTGAVTLSTADVSGLGTSAALNAGSANGVATLDASGKLSSGQIPAISVVAYLGSVANEAAMLALTGQPGDWCLRSDLSTNWIITGNDPTQLSSWTQLSYPTAPVTSVAGRTGAVTLSTADISGLGTIATQAADSVSITGGVISGLTSLGIASGTITASSPALDITQTWNAAGTTFTGIRANITNTASATGSRVLDLQVGGTSIFRVEKDSKIVVNNAYEFTFSGDFYNVFPNTNFYGMWVTVKNGLVCENGNFYVGTFTNSNNGRIQIASHTTSAGGIGFGTDTVLYRSAAHTLKTDDDLIVGGSSTVGSQLTVLGTSISLGADAAAANRHIDLNTAAGYDRQLRVYTGGSLRWRMDLGDGTAESGSNAGTNFALARYSDAGSSLGTALSINRSTGNATFGSAVTVTGAISASNLSGTNTGDQTITLTGHVTGSGTGSFATTIGSGVVTNAMLAGSIDLTTKVTGTLPVANGGTGAATAPDARTNLGATTVGSSLFTLTNPTAITFLQVNADNTVSALDAATFRSAIGAGTSSTTGTVTSVSGTGTVSGLTLTGSVTSSGSLTLGGTLSVTASDFSSQTANTFLAAPNGSAGTPTFRTIVAADIPTLNQNTTGTAANVTGTVAVANGGTGATTLTGVVKGNGTSAFTAATAGTDYVAPATATTFTATQTFSGSTSTLASVLTNAAEVVTVSATAATGTITFDVTTQSVLYYTSNASGGWTMNFRASSGTSLNTAMAIGQSVTVVFMATNGSTAYRSTAVQVDGVSITPRWQGGSAPSTGNANSIDVYSYTIIKTANATFTVLASQTRFA